MIVGEIEKLLDEYRSWLKDKTTLRGVGDSWVEITTPYLDRHNDSLQIYARQANGGYLLSDDSYTIHDLEASGCSLNTEKRRDLLKMTLNGFGVKLNAEALEIHATPETFPLRKHNLIQAMLAVNDLFFLAKPMVESLFLEDVIAWLDANEVRYTPQVKFTGIADTTTCSILLSRNPESSPSGYYTPSTDRPATQLRSSYINGTILAK